MLKLLSLFLPTLFPSWRFFDQIGPSARIEVRFPGLSGWQPLSPLPARLTWREVPARLIFSAARNEHLFLVSTATRLAIEPSPDLQAFFIQRLRASLPANGAPTFEVRVAFLAREEGRIGRFIDFESGPVPREL